MIKCHSSNFRLERCTSRQHIEEWVVGAASKSEEGTCLHTHQPSYIFISSIEAIKCISCWCSIYGKKTLCESVNKKTKLALNSITKKRAGLYSQEHWRWLPTYYARNWSQNFRPVWGHEFLHLRQQTCNMGGQLQHARAPPELNDKAQPWPNSCCSGCSLKPSIFKRKGPRPVCDPQ